MTFAAMIFSAILFSAAPLADTGSVSGVFTRAAPAVVKLYGAAAGREHGYGTGVIVSADGRILTVQSLLVTGTTVRVVLNDGRRYDARVVRSDDQRQLTLLQIEATGLPFLPPEKSDHLAAGDPIIALGNYFKIAEGEEPVSAVRGILGLRLHSLQANRLAQEFEYAGPALVHDAITANPGAAGGPVLDGEGRFIGLIGKVVEAAATNTRLNYAVPGEELLAFLAGSRPVAVASNSTTTAPTRAGKPYVGIKISDLGYRHVSAFVERVRKGSPAHLAGIQADDLIVTVDNRRITDAHQCRKILAELLPGRAVPFTIKRGEQVLMITVTIGVEP